MPKARQRRVAAASATMRTSTTIETDRADEKTGRAGSAFFLVLRTTGYKSPRPGILLPQLESLQLPRRRAGQVAAQLDPARELPWPRLILHVNLKCLQQ